MVSSDYSDPQNVDFATGVTLDKKFARCQEKCMNFDFKVLEIIMHQVYRFGHAKINN